MATGKQHPHRVMASDDELRALVATPQPQHEALESRASVVRALCVTARDVHAG